MKATHFSHSSGPQAKRQAVQDMHDVASILSTKMGVRKDAGAVMFLLLMANIKKLLKQSHLSVAPPHQNAQ